MPTKAKAKAEPKPWQRERPGRYRSSDGRFAIEQGDPGRWFLVDEEAHDELGLPRTLGPYATLDDARAEADTLRAGPPPQSPLAERLAEAAAHPQPDRKPRGRSNTRDIPAAAPAARRGRTAEPPAPGPEPVAPPPPPSWLDELPSEQAVHARRAIAALEKLGVEDAEHVVRRDVQTVEPAVADALLRRFVASRAVEPWANERIDGIAADHAPLREALAAGRRAGLSEAQLRGLAHEVAAAAAGLALDAVSEFDRDPGADGLLPGWQLVEHPGSAGAEPRRMHLPANE